MEQNIKQTKL